MTLFVDTSALLAVLYAGDQSHAGARAVWESEVRAGTPFVCTNYVVLETVALLQRRLGFQAVEAFISAMMPLLQVFWVDDALHRAGTTALLAAGRRQLSLVDCVSFEVMRRLGLRQAFAFDSDFTDQGFECLP